MIKKLASYVIVFAAGSAIAIWFDKDVHEITETVVYKDRVRTVVKEVITERPDGTKITERTTNKDEKKKQTANRKESKPVAKNWAAGIDYELFSNDQVYTGRLYRRVLGDIYVGGYGTSRGDFGVGITVLF